MTRAEAEKVALELLETAKINFIMSANLSLLPVTILFVPDSRGGYSEDIISMPYTSDEEKYAMLRTAEDLIVTKGATVAVHISEVWVAVPPPGQQLPKKASMYAGRTEAICVAMKSKNFEFTAMAPFSRMRDGFIQFQDPAVQNMQINLFGHAFKRGGNT